jgi:hypothetical protein
MDCMLCYESCQDAILTSPDPANACLIKQWLAFCVGDSVSQLPGAVRMSESGLQARHKSH